MEVGSIGTVRVTAEKRQTTATAEQAQKVLEAVETATSRAEAQNQAAQKQSAEQMREQLQRLAVEMNEVAKPLQTRISFGFSDEAGMMYLNVIDGDSGRVIRQFPSNEAIEFAAKMREWVGMLLDKTI